MAVDAERSRGGGRVSGVQVSLVTVRVVFVIVVAAAAATVTRRLKIIPARRVLAQPPQARAVILGGKAVTAEGLTFTILIRKP